jgi:hypothetical protein
MSRKPPMTDQTVRTIAVHRSTAIAARRGMILLVRYRIGSSSMYIEWSG